MSMIQTTLIQENTISGRQVAVVTKLRTVAPRFLEKLFPPADYSNTF
jgi:hypothetical protein